MSGLSEREKISIAISASWEVLQDEHPEIGKLIEVSGGNLGEILRAIHNHGFAAGAQHAYADARDHARVPPPPGPTEPTSMVLDRQARKFLGLAPFDGPENLVRGDYIFASHCKRRFGAVVWDAKLNELRGRR